MADKSGERLLKHALLERLMHYYYYVGQRGEGATPDTVASAEVARFLNMDDTLVRKDLAAIGVRGYPRVGFRTAEIVEAIRRVLGFNDSYRAVIIGAGRLGGALASYTDFARLGLHIVAVFDNDPSRYGSMVSGVAVQPMENLESVVAWRAVRLAILTVPAVPAQSIADRLVRAGVQAIWNFAPTALVTPPDTVVRHEHIAVGLAELSYHLKRRQTCPPEPRIDEA